MSIPKPKHFAERQPCVVLLLNEAKTEAMMVLSDENNEPVVFPKFTKARKHVSQTVDPELHSRVTYANVSPKAGAGDREETNNKRCLRCNGFLRAAPGEVIEVGNQTLETTSFVCPSCDKE